MAVTAGRRRGPDIVIPVVEADSQYRVRVRRRWHARTSGVGLNSFVREWSATKWEGRHGLMQVNNDTHGFPVAKKGIIG